MRDGRTVSARSVMLSLCTKVPCHPWGHIVIKQRKKEREQDMDSARTVQEVLTALEERSMHLRQRGLKVCKVVMRGLIEYSSERRVGGKHILRARVHTFCLADNFLQGACDHPSPNNEIAKRLGIKGKFLRAWGWGQRGVLGAAGLKNIEN